MMRDKEKEACSILDEAAAALSLAHNIVRTVVAKQMISNLYNELIALRDELNTRSQGYDPTKLKALLAETNTYVVSTKFIERPATNSGSAALDLACAHVKHAAILITSCPEDIINKLALDCLSWLVEATNALARYEESPSSIEDH